MVDGKKEAFVFFFQADLGLAYVARCMRLRRISSSSPGIYPFLRGQRRRKAALIVLVPSDIGLMPLNCFTASAAC